jgi:hypothetical protein
MVAGRAGESTVFRLAGLAVRVSAREPALWVLGAVSRFAAFVCSSATGVVVLALYVRALGDEFSSPLPLLSQLGSAFQDAAESVIRHFGFLLVGAWIASTLLIMALDALYVSAVVRRARRIVTGEGGALGPVLPEAALGFGRALATSLLLLPLRIAGALYAAAAIGATLIAYIGAVSRETSGAAASLALALAVSLAIVLNVALQLLSELALVRAVSADQRPAGAVADAAGLLRRAPLKPLALTILFGILSAIVTFGVTSFASMFQGSEERLGQAIELAFALVIPAISGILAAAIDVAQWSALTAFELDERGELPVPPAPAEPVVPAEPILPTELVVPTEFAGGGA